MRKDTRELELLGLINDEIVDESLIPDEKAYAEEEQLALEAMQLDNESKKQDIKARRKYAKRIFSLTKWWLVVVASLVVLDGFGSVYGFFKIEDNVLVTMLGGTTINILGLFAIVATYLFPKNSGK
jgi:hypothetical protein